MSEVREEEYRKNQVRILLNALYSSPDVREELIRHLLPGMIENPRIEYLFTDIDVPTISYVDLEDKKEVDNPLEKKVSSLEDRMSNVENILKEINENMVERLNYEPLKKFEEFIREVSEVKAVFYRQTEDGFDFWTLFESENRFESLKKIVAFQIELDKSYKAIFFDFKIDHVDDIDNEEIEGWNPLYIQKIR